jgi:hypothetical protein
MEKLILQTINSTNLIFVFDHTSDKTKVTQLSICCNLARELNIDIYRLIKQIDFQCDGIALVRTSGLWEYARNQWFDSRKLEKALYYKLPFEIKLDSRPNDDIAILDINAISELPLSSMSSKSSKSSTNSCEKPLKERLSVEIKLMDMKNLVLIETLLQQYHYPNKWQKETRHELRRNLIIVDLSSIIIKYLVINNKDFAESILITYL